MAKKEMKMAGDNCGMCNSSPCCCYGNCWNRWCKTFCGLIVVVLGLLLIWPKGWFTYWHTLGLLVVLLGLWKLGHSLFKCK